MAPKIDEGKKLAAEAERNGFRWCAQPPEEGHPMPLVGWRLMQATDDSIFGWVCIMLGHEDVMRSLADHLNKEDVVSYVDIPSLKDFVSTDSSPVVK